MPLSHFRAPTAAEGSLLSRLLEADFPGRDALAKQAATTRVRSIDKYGSLELSVVSGERAAVTQRVPVEGEAADIDGVPISIMLHVVDERLKELEILKADGSPIVKMLAASDLHLLRYPEPPGIPEGPTTTYLAKPSAAQEPSGHGSLALLADPLKAGRVQQRVESPAPKRKKPKSKKPKSKKRR